MPAQRELGKTGIFLTETGLGTWAIGGPWEYGWGSQNDEESIEALLEGLEGGINWIDTAPAYGLGHAEKVISKVLKQWPHRVILATKCGLIPSNLHQGEVESCLRYISVKKEAEQSLKRLGVDCIDIYQIHWPKPVHQIEEAFRAIMELKQEGKIRVGAVSNFSVPQMQKISLIGDVASNQIPYSLLDQRMETDMLPFCEQKKIGILAYSPLKHGLLTGKCSVAWRDRLPADDYRKKYNSAFSDPEFKLHLDFVGALSLIAVDLGMTVAQLAIKWVLRQKSVTSAIIGVRKKGQIVPFLESRPDLNDETIRRVKELHEIYTRKLRALAGKD